MGRAFRPTSKFQRLSYNIISGIVFSRRSCSASVLDKLPATQNGVTVALTKMLQYQHGAVDALARSGSCLVVLGCGLGIQRHGCR